MAKIWATLDDWDQVNIHKGERKPVVKDDEYGKYMDDSRVSEEVCYEGWRKMGLPALKQFVPTRIKITT